MAASISASSSSKAPAAAAKRKGSQPSRKTKSSWRRNIDLSEVDDHLEASRAAKRQGLIAPGVEAETVKDGDLFEVDVKGDEALGKQMSKGRGVEGEKRRRKQMRSLQALDNQSAERAVSGRRGIAGSAAGGKVKTGKMSKAEQDRLRRIAGRPVKGPFGAIVENEQGNALETLKGAILREPAKDAWDNNTGAADSKGMEDPEASNAASTATSEWINDPRTKRPKAPIHPRLTADAAAASLRRHRPVPVGGQSYNPALKSHDALLQQAYEIEKAKQDRIEQERQFKQKWTEAAKVAAAEMGLDDDGTGSSSKPRRFAGMIIGDDPNADLDEESIASETEAVSKPAPRRKTKQERLKSARAKQRSRELAAAQSSKTLSSSLSQLPSLRKKLTKDAASRSAALSERKAAKLAQLQERGLAGSRVGKHKIPLSLASRSASSVQLGEDLSEGLRGVKSDANGFRDMWDGLVLKGEAEYRLPVGEGALGGARRKGGEKKLRKREYETHSYKRFT